jgi:hypothetical protein
MKRREFIALLGGAAAACGGARRDGGGWSKIIQHTVRYTELAPDRFKDFWR